MKIIEDIKDMHQLSSQLRQGGRKIGFVPTMGALHQGHMSLIEKAEKDTDIVVVSIFVNPIQFGPGEDYREYPRDMEGDMEKARNAGVDILFTPLLSSIYPEGYRTYVEVEGLSDLLCGRSRPGHFRGVATVVLKLFNIVMPHRAYFGQKDYQQSVIIRKMTEDLNLPVEIIVLPTVRERDGLAMSSRNLYLKPDERRAATILYKSLQTARSLFINGETSSSMLKQSIINSFKGEPLAQLEYVALIHPETLEGEEKASRGSVIAIAAKVGRTRLIDNIIL